MRISSTRFTNVWALAFGHERIPGEPINPTSLLARDLCTGRTVQVSRDKLGRPPGRPFPVDDVSLVVIQDEAQIGCMLALGWSPPVNVLSLRAEQRLSANRTKAVDDRSVPFPEESLDIDGVVSLLNQLEPGLDMPRALVRGRYASACAEIERTGIPVDSDALARIRDRRESVRRDLIRRIDAGYGVYAGETFVEARWRLWLEHHGIDWPSLQSGRLALDDDTFKDMSLTHSSVAPMWELRRSLRSLRGEHIAVGLDGRARCQLRPFASRTGRNQPRTSEWIFGQPAWMRALIRPEPGTALAHIDWSQQEFGIAAALSGDERMIAAYSTGDPYLEFARQAGAKDSAAEREKYKQAVMAVQYSMGARSLARRLGCDEGVAESLLRRHHATYADYWRWSDNVERHAFMHSLLRSAYGWTIRVEADANPRSVRNFPVQANGAEMLRLACIYAVKRGIRVCTTVHDAILVEFPVGQADAAVREARRAMADASAFVLDGFRLRTEVKLIRHPDRYMDPRGQDIWQFVAGQAGIDPTV